MQYVPAETIEQAQEWWNAGIVVYKGWEGGDYYSAGCLNDPGSGDDSTDNDPSHYFVILEE